MRPAGWLLLVALAVGCRAAPSGGVEPGALTLADFAFMPGVSAGFVEAYSLFLRARAGDQPAGGAVPTYGQAAQAFVQAGQDTTAPHLRLRCNWFVAFCRFLDLDFSGAAEAVTTLPAPAGPGADHGAETAPPPDGDVADRLAELLQRCDQTRETRAKLTTFDLRTRLAAPVSSQDQARTISLLTRHFQGMSVNLAENREKLNQALCTANLRHLGVAIHLYAQDNGGLFPESYDYAAKQIWQFKVLAYTGSPSWEGRGDVWQCPSCRAGAFCYGINQNVSIRDPAFPAAGSREWVLKPGETVLLADSVHYLPGAYPQSPDYDGAAYKISWDKEHMGTGTTDWNRHSGGANVLFVDGRVEWRASADGLGWLGR